jgi:acyl carrier protein
MTDAEIRALILELICEIAPEADPATVRDQDDIREVFDLDSMDFTNLVIAIHERTNVDIPEVDYNKLFILGNGVAYLRDALSHLSTRG